MRSSQWSLRRRFTKTVAVAATVTATILSGTSAAAAAGPPEGGGGCHMVYSPTTTGLTHMMVGSAHGEGAGKMVEMLAQFSNEPFCGV